AVQLSQFPLGIPFYLSEYSYRHCSLICRIEKSVCVCHLLLQIPEDLVQVADIGGNMLQLKETGLRYGDSCTLISPLKPKKSIALNRTRWDILPEADQEYAENPVIAIPGAKSRSFRWRLELETV